MSGRMKQEVTLEIKKFVAGYQEKHGCATKWGEPIVGYADAGDPLFLELRDIVIETHALPSELLSESRTVIAFFLPFAKSITATNSKKVISSAEWATGYIETNELISALNEYMSSYIKDRGHLCTTISATHNWIEDKLISNWSHRHIAYIAGIGRFGLNNMLITEKGCSGRIGSFVTSADIEADSRPDHEFCLYKYDGSCVNCVDNCVNEALYEGSFDRFKCYEMLLKNVEEHRRLGYADVCGKCLAAVPCSHIAPASAKRRIQKRQKS